MAGLDPGGCVMSIAEVSDKLLREDMLPRPCSCAHRFGKDSGSLPPMEATAGRHSTRVSRSPHNMAGRNSETKRRQSIVSANSSIHGRI